MWELALTTTPLAIMAVAAVCSATFHWLNTGTETRAPSPIELWKLTDGGTKQVNTLSGVTIDVKPKITPELRAELDETPEWWDKQFHRLLGEIFAEQFFQGEYETIVEHTLTGGFTSYTIHPEPVYVDCVGKCCASKREIGY